MSALFDKYLMTVSIRAAFFCVREVVVVVKLWAPSVLCHYGRRYVDGC